MILTREIILAAKELARVAAKEGATSVRVTCFGNLRIHRSGEKPEVFTPKAMDEFLVQIADSESVEQ